MIDSIASMVIGNTAYQAPPTLATNAYNKKRGICPDAAQTHLSFAFARTEWKPS